MERSKRSGGIMQIAGRRLLQDSLAVGAYGSIGSGYGDYGAGYGSSGAVYGSSGAGYGSSQGMPSYGYGAYAA
jgi:hypothetical protein